MNKLSLFATLLRDRLSERTLARVPEPDLVMDDPEQVAAYNQAGSIDGLMASAYLFHSARVTQVIQGCREVVDLACGPAIQLCQIAELNPNVQFHGVDYSTTMLEQARANAQAKGLANVRFTHGDITRLDFIGDRSVDGAISTMALHHLPTYEHLRQAFTEIDRILKPGAALYLVDFGRLKQSKTVEFFVAQNADEQPPLFNLDYENSLRAAFELEDFRRMTTEVLHGRGKLYSTFMVPMLTLIKTADHPLPPGDRERVKALAAAMPPRYRSDLNDLRIFFRLGGLGNDPFA